MNKINYPKYVPEWYDPKISYSIMKKYGDKSPELKNYLKNGIVPEMEGFK